MSSRRLFSTVGDPSGPPGGWQITFADGREFLWEGFYTGPVELTRDELDHAARQLLGLSIVQVPQAAAVEIAPAVTDDGTGPCIVLHSATPILKSLQGDLAECMHQRVPDDVAAYVETRAVSLARQGDLVVGRTDTWKMAAELAGVEAVVIPGIDYYYLSQAIIQLILSSQERPPEIERLVTALASQPDTVVRLYSLDLETQIVLLYLKRAAGIEHIYVDANSPQVASYWNTKAPIHPLVNEVLAVTAADPYALLQAETEFAPMRRKLALSYERLPGYALEGNHEDAALVAEQMRNAARLLKERYGVLIGCLKPSEGGGGARIMTGVDLTDDAKLLSLADMVWRTREQFVLEANVEYMRLQLGCQNFGFAPSAHVRYGRVAPGVTLQLTNGPQWQGNIYLDRAACAEAGVPVEVYDNVLRTVEEMRAALDARGEKLVTGGVDFAVGRVPGVFGDRLFVAVQDPNLSSHGAEYLRRFLDDLASTGGPRYAATKVIRPTATGTLKAMRALDHVGATEGSCFRVISAIPGRWGMLAAGAANPVNATEEVLAFEKDLIGRGMTSEVQAR